MSVSFGHCVGCDQPIRPPFLSFEVRQSVEDGNTVWNWEEIDVCAKCEDRLTAKDLHRLVSDDASADTHPKGGDAKQAPFMSGAAAMPDAQPSGESP